MRRSSIITTLLLVLVIIGLVVALVVTNLPPKQEVTDPNNEQVVGEENVGEEKEEPETPTNVALDSEVVKQAYKTLSVTEDAYYLKGVTEVTRENLQPYKIILAAYIICDKDKIQERTYENNGSTYTGRVLDAEEIDRCVRLLYGDIEYQHCNFGNGISKIAAYNEEDNMYYFANGGGGGYFSYSVRGIVNAEEYSDRYEITEKYLYVESHDTGNGSNYEIRTWHSGLSQTLGYFRRDDSLEVSPQTLNELLADVTVKAIYTGDVTAVQYQSEKDTIENHKKILSKYYDQATEYKHTFMKNEDGTFYWYKSEIIK